MKITIVEKSQSVLPNIEGASEVPFLLGAKIMATCVSNSPVETFTTEPLAKTILRKETTLTERHHSGYDFEHITLALEDVSKMFCMYLNNLHVYSTEETSGRHKELVLPSKERAVFDYFYDKFYKYGLEKNPDAEGDKRALRKIRQTALENARYTTGLDAKTNICYGISLRQLNYIYGWAEKFLEKQEYNPYEALVVDEMAQFLEIVDSLDIDGTKIIDPILKNDPYNRQFNLFGCFTPRKPHYGATYEVYYDASATAFAQLQRHRAINYTINYDENAPISYYSPKIVREMDLTETWEDKIEGLNNVPQARLLSVQETGTIDQLINRQKERACLHAQEETRDISSKVAYEAFVGLKDYDAELSRELCDRYLNKNRCFFPDYEHCPCPTPCKKSDAIVFEDEMEHF